MRQDAALRSASCSGGIDDAGDIIFLAHDEIGSAFALEVFPAEGARQIGAQRGFGHENNFGRDRVKLRRLA